MISWGHNEVCHSTLTVWVWVLIAPAVHVPGVQGAEHAPGGGSHDDLVLQFLPVAPRGCVPPQPPYGGVHPPCICHCACPADATHSYRALEVVHAFNPYDLYSKTDEPVDPVKLRPYYESLIAKFFLSEVDW